MTRCPENTGWLPTTMEAMHRLGWSQADVILVSGDTYIDSPHIGVAVIGRVLADAGYRVGIIAQPDIHGSQDISRLGEPRFFWGVSAGSVDSMIANRTASGKPRRKDDLTPGGRNHRRPDRATVVYANLIRRYFKKTVPIVLGGIEASLRRISHYDAWSDRVRRSILFDAKADYLIYGMGEQSVLELAGALRAHEDPRSIRGLCYISARQPEPGPHFSDDDLLLPSHEEVAADTGRFARMFALFYANCDPRTGRRLLQKQDTRFLVHNPPQPPLSPEALDAIYELPFSHDHHPFHAGMGHAPALDTIRFALTTHRGCFGECRFCAIAVHQGREVVSRSPASLVREARALAAHPRFKGILANVGGPTANMYAMTCRRMRTRGACPTKGCLFPQPCSSLKVDHGPQIELLRALRRIPGVRKVFVGSGLRHDLIVADRRNGQAYLEEIVRHHASGQLKIAPEHVSRHVLDLMGKPGPEVLEQFMAMFKQAVEKTGVRVFLTYYLMAAHPGCTQSDMRDLRTYSLKRLKVLPEQIQIFTPSPSTFATLMYMTCQDPFSGHAIEVEKNPRDKQKQKAVMGKRRPHRETK